MSYRYLLLLFLVLSENIYAQTLGNYPTTSTMSGHNVIVTPSAVPGNTAYMLVTTSAEFMGVLTGNPSNGKVRVVDPRPAGTYTVKVKAFTSSGSSISRTFTLTVTPTDCSIGTFSAGAIVPTGPNQVGTVVGDFNQDGIQDIAAAHEGGHNTLSIRIGTGTGAFTGTTEIPVGSHPYNVGIGDFDRNGTQDLVTTNSGDNCVTPILGSGTGSFTVQQVCDVGTGPISVVVADWNSDGFPDLATANLNSNNVSIRFGIGTGFFYGTTEIPVGQNPYHLALGDFNGDGKYDFATANSNGNSVSIRLGNGAGGFTAGPDVSVGLNPLCVVVGDFNEDGKQDIATANYAVNTMSIRFGLGNGYFYGSTDIPTAIGPYFIATGNFNGDTHNDLAIANYFDNTVSIKFGNGVGGFVNGVDVPVGSYPTGVTTGEFNQDNFMDFVVSNFNDGAISIHLGLVGVPPVDSIRANSPLCEGMDLELHAFGGVNYAWTGPTGFTSASGYSIRQSMTLADSGLYQVTIIDSGHCVANESLHVTVWPSPVVNWVLSPDTFCVTDGQILMTGGTPVGGLYVGSNAILGNYFDCGLAGVGSHLLYYVYSDQHDCSSSDSQKVYIINCDVGVTEFVDENSPLVFPNPNNGNFMIQSRENSAVKLFTPEGLLIKEWYMREGEKSDISLEEFSAGIYILKFQSADRSYSVKIVRQ